MSQSGQRASLRGAVHSACAADPKLGWAVCLTAWKVGLAVHARIGNRIRIAVAESGSQVQYDPIIDQLRTAAVRLGVEGYSARRSVELLNRVLTRVHGEDATPEPSLILMDLYASGYAETACLNAPPPIHLARNHHVKPHFKPIDVSEVQSAIVVTGDGDAILAFSPTAARDVVPDAISAVATKSATFSDPCRFRDDHLRVWDERAPMLPAPPMAVLFRPFGGH